MPPRTVNRAAPAPPPVADAPQAVDAIDVIMEPTEGVTQPATNTGQASLLPALSPAHTNEEVINYSTSDGMKLYSASISPLPIKDFEGNGTDTQTWINDLIERSEAMNWMFILTVVINGIGFFIPRCLTLTIQQVKTHSLS